MAETALVKKLLIKPDSRLLVLNAPEGYLQQLAPLPEKADLHTTPDGLFDWVQVFVGSKAEVGQYAAIAVQALKPGGVLWFVYPKKTSKIKTDINRDTGWETIRNVAFEAVTQVAIDATWSALRFRPLSEIKTLTRRNR